MWAWGRYHGGRRPSSDDSFHSPTVIPPSALDKPTRVSRSVTIVGERAVAPHPDDGNASWYSVCRVPMVEWRVDCENCRHLTVVGLYDTGPRRDYWRVVCHSSESDTCSKASVHRAADPGLSLALHMRFFFRSSYISDFTTGTLVATLPCSRRGGVSDFTTGTPVATLPGARRGRVSARAGLPRVSVLWLGATPSLIYNLYLSVTARVIAKEVPSLRWTSILLGR